MNISHRNINGNLAMGGKGLQFGSILYIIAPYE
jgi:hypothetical protein